MTRTPVDNSPRGCKSFTAFFFDTSYLSRVLIDKNIFRILSKFNIDNQIIQIVIIWLQIVTKISLLKTIQRYQQQWNPEQLTVSTEFSTIINCIFHLLNQVFNITNCITVDYRWKHVTLFHLRTKSFSQILNKHPKISPLYL